jgi:hypothetical protein
MHSQNKPGSERQIPHFFLVCRIQIKKRKDTRVERGLLEKRKGTRQSENQRG